MRVRRDMRVVYIEQQEPMWKFARVQIGGVWIHAIRDLAHIGTAQIDSCRAIFAFFVPHSFAQRFRNLQTMVLQITGNRMPADLCRCLKKEEKDSMREF